MATPLTIKNHCAQCGQEYPADVLVCPKCKIILVTPGAPPRRTPWWVIALLLAAIAVLFIYACMLFWQVAVKHQY